MYGNVWVWGSWRDEDEVGSLSNRVYRGGNWSFSVHYIRPTTRYRFTPGYSDCYLGFRIARVQADASK